MHVELSISQIAQRDEAMDGDHRLPSLPGYNGQQHSIEPVEAGQTLIAVSASANKKVFTTEAK